jgi:hypothetical protein
MTSTDLIPLDALQDGIKAGTEHFAFPIYRAIPEGCVPWPVRDDRHAPHLQPEEFAVIDPTDREFVSGELYLIQQNHGPILWQVSRRKEGIWFSPLNRPRSGAEVDRIVRETPPLGLLPLHMSDGPLKPEYLPEMILGRVIGVWQPPSRI